MTKHFSNDIGHEETNDAIHHNRTTG